MTNQPVLNKRDRGFSVAFFTEDYANPANGEIRTRFSCALQRSYKDKNGQWQQKTIDLFPEELLILANLATESYNLLNDYLNRNRSAGRQTAPSNDAPIDDDIPF